MGAAGCTEHRPSEAHADLSPGEAQPIAFPCADSVVPTAWARRGAGGWEGLVAICQETLWIVMEAGKTVFATGIQRAEASNAAKHMMLGTAPAPAPNTGWPGPKYHATQLRNPGLTDLTAQTWECAWGAGGARLTPPPTSSAQQELNAHGDLILPPLVMMLQNPNVILGRITQEQGKNHIIDYSYMSEFRKNFQTKRSLLQNV